jgi:hypothetical protein
LRGYRLKLAVDSDTGQIIRFVLLRGDARDHRLTAVLARQRRRLLGRRLAGVVADSGCPSQAAVRALLEARIPFILGFVRAACIRARLATLPGQQRRWLQQGGAIRLGWCPAVGFRVLARNLALGLQICEAGARPAVLYEPRAFRAAHVEGLGLFVHGERTISHLPYQPSHPATWHVPSGLTVQFTWRPEAQL